MYQFWNDVTEILILVNRTVYGLFVPTLMDLFFRHYDYSKHCFLTWFAILICTTVLGIVVIYDGFVSKKVSRNEIRRGEAHFNKFKIGCSLVSYSGVVVNLIVCCFGTKPEIFVTAHVIHTLTNFVVTLNFVSPALDYLVMDIEMHKKHLKNVILCQIAGIIILPLLTHHIRTWNETSAIMFSQLLDLNREEHRKSTESLDSTYEQDDYTKSHESIGSFCGVCYRTYSDKIKTRTPRLLRKCGHTICEDCAGEILKNNYYIDIPCPFCMEMTRVVSARRLSKNYALLEGICELKRLKAFYKCYPPKKAEFVKLERRYSFS
ncbi:Protein CBG26870 [Caenorhabditis briggsae]|uniref:Protein CBG26870 n=1 Tax=Caenorhabditis briggsae TaxID=6238 RepID=B6II70_CAEBR|nr:Protein CBG26870 [Caenorhabditis briggsae]CAR99600.1 Protein CBG26870 [Caenorhabditis briggsae]